MELKILESWAILSTHSYAGGETIEENKRVVTETSQNSSSSWREGEVVLSPGGQAGVSGVLAKSFVTMHLSSQLQTLSQFIDVCSNVSCTFLCICYVSQ